VHPDFIEKSLNSSLNIQDKEEIATNSKYVLLDLPYGLHANTKE